MKRYKYTVILLVTFLLAWSFGTLGYVDSVATYAAGANQILFAFVAGALYSFSFTAAFAVLLFSNLTVSQEAVLPLAVIAATGGLIMDVTLLRFIKGALSEEMTTHAKRIVERYTKRRPVRFLLQVLGGAVIASPLPEEIGLTLLGISHLSFWRIISVTYVLDIIGAYLVITIASHVL
jgi:hypothetical protein